MLSVVFWNINRQPRATLLGKLAHQHRADLVVVAECEERDESDAEITESLQKYTGRSFYTPDPLSRRVRLYSGLHADVVRPVAVEFNGRMAVQRIVLRKTDILLVAVHLPSKVNRSLDDQLQSAQIVSNLIRSHESDFGHRRTVLIGDLNMNPFDAGMVAAYGLHGVMTRSIALEFTRTVDAEVHPFFYNPMWGRLGDLTVGPAGTHYCRLSKPTEYFWNTFDQVLIRPELLNAFADDLQVVTNIDGVDLLSNNGIPDRRVGSDHLPLAIRLNLD